jgi:hypothetical protein
VRALAAEFEARRPPGKLGDDGAERLRIARELLAFY